MAKYTMEVRELISTFGEDEVKGWFSDYELSDFLTDEEIRVITERGTWSKEKLCQRIIDHYFTREIGTDAVGQFILFVKDKMNEIMETARKIKPDAMIYGEGWDMPTILPADMKATIANQAKMPGIGHFNDFFRDIIKSIGFNL